MPENMTTVKTGFPVYDVTHKPKRSQSGNLKAVAKDNELSPTEGGVKAPSIVTLERAINFYESHAEGELSNLYIQTAKWLREYMSRSVETNVKTSLEEVEDDSEVSDV